MGRAYSAGNLSFEFTGNSAGGVKAIDSLITKLKELKTVTSTLNFSNLAEVSTQLNTLISTAKNADSNGLKNINKITSAFVALNEALKNISFDKTSDGFGNFIKGLSQAMVPLKQIAGTMQSLSGISKAVNSISRIPKVLEKINSVNFNGAKASFQKLADAVSPFLNKIEKSQDSIVALSKIINTIGGSGARGKGGGRTSFGSSGLFKLLTFTGIVYNAKRLGRAIANIVTQGSNYTETLNKWQVAMRGNVQYAEEFVNKMNQAYGISRETLMNAQSTFKNMIGSLGQISEETAYNLSKGITQMAIDYSSLYNVKLETAFSKFQAMLAGQVRPIRTDSGYDITETTLFQLYQSLGGEKSMRQLTRTEKQLLSVLSVFKQMDRSGALGDMSKTIDNFANQSRMLAENIKETVTWIGISIQYLLQENEILVKLNGLMIVAAKVAKQFAENLGYTDPDFGLGWSENVENTSLALDELNGKLLGFDKFRSLKGSADENLAIDKVLENAISAYTSALTSGENPAEDFANGIIEAFGGVENLTISIERLVNVLLNLVGAIALFSAGKAIGGFIEFFKTGKSLFSSYSAKATLVLFAIAAIVQLVIAAVKAFQEGDIAGGLLATTIGVTLVSAILLFKTACDAVSAGSFFRNYFGAKLSIVAISVLAIGAAVAYFVQNMDKLKEKGRTWVPVLVALAAAIVALVASLYLLKGNWVAALSIAGIVGAAGAGIATYFATMDFEQGGTIPNIDSGTIFRAGENGKTEAVYTAPDGSTNVANVQQMKAAFYGALVEYGKSSGGSNGEIAVYINDEPVFNAVQKAANKKGLAFAKKG